MNAIACDVCGRFCDGVANLVVHYELRHSNEPSDNLLVRSQRADEPRVRRKRR